MVSCKWVICFLQRVWLCSRVSSVQNRTDVKSRRASLCRMILSFYFAFKGHSCMVTCCTSSPDDRNNDGDLADTWAAVPEAVPQVLRVLLTSGTSWAHEALWKVHPGPQRTDADEHLCSSVNLWIMALVFLSHSVLMPRSTAGILKADTPSTSCMYNITDTKPRVQTHLWWRWMRASVDRPVLHRCLNIPLTFTAQSGAFIWG